MAKDKHIEMREWKSCVHYYDGLFMKARDFTLEQTFHTMAVRYLNYLLFNPGRLYTANEAMPLEVTSVGDTITIGPGSAMIRKDGAEKIGHEVHLKESFVINLTDEGYEGSTNSPTTVYVRIDHTEKIETDIPGVSGAGADITSSNNRMREKAVIVLTTEETVPEDDYSVLLATVDYLGQDETAIVTNDTTRGGIRFEILSSDLLEQIGGSIGPSNPEITDVEPGNGAQSGGEVILSGTGLHDAELNPNDVAHDTEIKIVNDSLEPSEEIPVESDITVHSNTIPELQALKFTMPQRPTHWATDCPVTIHLSYNDGEAQRDYQYNDSGIVPVTQPPVIENIEPSPNIGAATGEKVILNGRRLHDEDIIVYNCYR